MFQDLAKLFQNSRRVKLLKFFIFQPEARMSAAEAGAAIGISKKDAIDEMRALERMKVVVSGKQKTRLYSVNLGHPLVEPIRAFLVATTLPDDRAILSAFKGVSGISLLVRTGELVHEGRASVDLLIVARKPRNPKIARAVRKAESMTGLPLRYAVMDPATYEERMDSYDRMLRDVFEFEHRFIVGKARD